MGQRWGGIISVLVHLGSICWSFCLHAEVRSFQYVMLACNCSRIAASACSLPEAALIFTPWMCFPCGRLVAQTFYLAQKQQLWFGGAGSKWRPRSLCGSAVLKRNPFFPTGRGTAAKVGFVVGTQCSASVAIPDETFSGRCWSVSSASSPRRHSSQHLFLHMWLPFWDAGFTGLW